MGLMKTALRAGGLAAAFAAMSAIGQPASAITCGMVTYTLTPNAGEFCGAGQNPSYSEDMDGIVREVFEFPGMEPMTFILSVKTNEPGGTRLITFDNAPEANEDSPGDWDISDPMGSLVVIVLKHADSWAAFLLSGTSGEWTTSGPGMGETMDLSHADIWYKPGNGSTEVPVPASLPLLLAALGGIGVLSRRRRAS